MSLFFDLVQNTAGVRTALLQCDLLLTRFLRINRDLRKQNNQALADLRLKTEERVLWNGPFSQLANSQVEAHFADVRSYIYKG